MIRSIFIYFMFILGFFSLHFVAFHSSFQSFLWLSTSYAHRATNKYIYGSFPRQERSCKVKPLIPDLTYIHYSKYICRHPRKSRQSHAYPFPPMAPQDSGSHIKSCPQPFPQWHRSITYNIFELKNVSLYHRTGSIYFGPQQCWDIKTHQEYLQSFK